MPYNLVLMSDENGVEMPSYDQSGNVLMHNDVDNSYAYVPISEELVHSFPQLRFDDATTAMDITDGDDTKQKAYWTYDATIMLINKYRAYYSLFANSIHKNGEVWEKIAEEFRRDGFSFCGAQCENRWKYVRGKYIKKKDNAGPDNTGADLYTFEYFNEIDEILGKKPNVSPKYLASSEKLMGSVKTSCTSSSSKKKTNAGRPNTTSTITLSSVTVQTSQASSFDGVLSTSANSTPATVDLTSDPVNEGATGTASLRRSCTNKSSATTAPRQRRRRLSYDDDGFSSIQSFFSQEDDDEVEGKEEGGASTTEEKKGKRKKEPWEENVQRQDRYHADMMDIQREGMHMFKDFMSQILECFRKN